MSGALVLLEKFEGVDDPAAQKLSEEFEIEQRIAEAREEAYAQGLEEGRAEAASETETLEQIAQSAASSLSDLLAAAPAQIEAEIGRGLHQIFAAMFPRLIEKGLIDEAAAALTERISLTSAAHVVVRAPERFVDGLRAALEAQAGGAAIVVEADDAIDGHAIEAAWMHGGLRFDFSESVDAILEALTPGDDRALAAQTETVIVEEEVDHDGNG